MVAGWKKLDGELLAVEMIGTSSGLCTWRSFLLSRDRVQQQFAVQITKIFSQYRVAVVCGADHHDFLPGQGELQRLLLDRVDQCSKEQILEPPRYFQFLASQRTVGVYVGLVTPFLHDRTLVEKIRIFNVVLAQFTPGNLDSIRRRARFWQSSARCSCDSLRRLWKNPHFQRGARAVRTWKFGHYLYELFISRHGGGREGFFRCKTLHFSDSVQLDVESQWR